MNTITSTELRTKTKWLIDMLLKGEKLVLTYRGKVIGTVEPVSSNI